MGKPSLLWQIILVALNVFVFLGIIQVWWGEKEMPPPGPSQKRESNLMDIPRRDSQPQAAYQVVAAKNLFSVHRRGSANTGNERAQKGDFEKNMLQGIIVIGRERAALVTSQDSTPKKKKIEIVRPGQVWNGYKVLEIGPEMVIFQDKEGQKTMVFPESKAKAGVVTRAE
jgi:hypothetical protein